MTIHNTDEQPTDVNQQHPLPPRKRRRRCIVVVSDDEEEDDSITDLTGRPHPTQPPHTHTGAPRLITTTLTKNLALIIHRHKQDDINFNPPNLGAMKPLPSMIPSLPTATYNVTSLSADVVDEAGLNRQRHMITDIETLTLRAAIIFVQETRLHLTATHTAAFPL